jgi:hypothetical protein
LGGTGSLSRTHGHISAGIVTVTMGDARVNLTINLHPHMAYQIYPFDILVPVSELKKVACLLYVKPFVWRLPNSMHPNFHGFSI